MGYLINRVGPFWRWKLEGYPVAGWSLSKAAAKRDGQRAMQRIEVERVSKTDPPAPMAALVSPPIQSSPPAPAPIPTPLSLTTEKPLPEAAPLQSLRVSLSAPGQRREHARKPPLRRYAMIGALAIMGVVAVVLIWAP